jgi:hypothetical protein
MKIINLRFRPKKIGGRSMTNWTPFIPGIAQTIGFSWAWVWESYYTLNSYTITSLANSTFLGTFKPNPLNSHEKNQTRVRVLLQHTRKKHIHPRGKL